MKKTGILILLFASFIFGQTVFLQDDFEDGNMDGWTPYSPNEWIVSSVGAINGSYSMRHNSQDTTNSAHVYISLNYLRVDTVNMSWRFNLKNGNFDPNTADKFWVYVMVHDTADVNGYAVGVNLSGETDSLTLWRLTNSAVDDTLITTAFDWGANDLVGIEVTRDSSGLWELKYDTDGNFDHLISAGAAFDDYYLQANYFAMSFYFRDEDSGGLWLDDVLVQSTNHVRSVAKAFLQGPFDTDSMQTTLSANGDLPSAQPFNGQPWNYDGGEILVGERPDIVDWILVQLRTGTDSSTTVATRAALLKKNGNIVDVDGSSPVSFAGISDGNYYVVLRHRNHLALMSAATISLSSESDLYDFSDGQAQAYGTNPMLELATGIFGMYTGDANGNGQIQNDDKNNFWKVQVGAAGYQSADFNLNGQVQNDDKNTYWKANVGLGTQVSF